MATANIRSWASIERIYSPESFSGDAAQNGLPTTEIVRGVLVLSTPNAAGDFELERAARHVGEPASDTFLAPYRRQDSAPAEMAQPGAPAGYAEFVADIVSAAERFGFDPETSPSRDRRLKGLRQ